MGLEHTEDGDDFCDVHTFFPLTGFVMIDLH